MSCMVSICNEFLYCSDMMASACLLLSNDWVDGLLRASPHAHHEKLACLPVNSISALVAPGICVATDPLTLLLQAWAFAAYVAALMELVAQVNCAEADSQRGRGSCELTSSFLLCRHLTALSQRPMLLQESVSYLDLTPRSLFRACFLVANIADMPCARAVKVNMLASMQALH